MDEWIQFSPFSYQLCELRSGFFGFQLKSPLENQWNPFFASRLKFWPTRHKAESMHAAQTLNLRRETLYLNTIQDMWIDSLLRLQLSRCSMHRYWFRRIESKSNMHSPPTARGCNNTALFQTRVSWRLPGYIRVGWALFDPIRSIYNQE